MTYKYINKDVSLVSILCLTREWFLYAISINTSYRGAVAPIAAALAAGLFVFITLRFIIRWCAR